MVVVVVVVRRHKRYCGKEIDSVWHWIRERAKKKNFKFRIRWCLLSSCTFFFLISFPYLMYIDTGQNDYSLCVCVKYGAFRFEFSFFFFNTQEKNLIC